MTRQPSNARTSARNALVAALIAAGVLSAGPEVFATEVSSASAYNLAVTKGGHITVMGDINLTDSPDAPGGHATLEGRRRVEDGTYPTLAQVGGHIPTATVWIRSLTSPSQILWTAPCSPLSRQEKSAASYSDTTVVRMVAHC